MENKKRIAFINQRYGLEINGGSETYTRTLAEHLKGLYDIDILTTKASDYTDWENTFTEDTEYINGIRVLRFDVSKNRDVIGMKVFSWLRRIKGLRRFSEEKWVDAQGPYCPALVEYIRTRRGYYDAFVFVTYLYYDTVRGIKAAGDRTVLIPTAHDEPYLYYDVYKNVFSAASAIIYLSEEEKTLAEKVFDVEDKPNTVAGSGIDVPEDADASRFREKYGIKGDYLIYAGRIDPSKGCGEMFDIFARYKRRHPGDDTKLVLLGRSAMDIPVRDDITAVGFVSEEDKFDGIKGALGLWMPSRYESLSISVLEAMALGVPVLVNGECDVLKGHVEKSGAGMWYASENEGEKTLSDFLDNSDRLLMSANARSYIDKNYRWDPVTVKVTGIIDRIAGE